MSLSNFLLFNNAPRLVQELDREGEPGSKFAVVVTVQDEGGENLVPYRREIT